MFGFGRKNSDFEWHKYVRTTIKLRREDRRAKIVGARDAAIDGLKEARASSYRGLGQLMKTASSAMFAFPKQLGRGLGEVQGALGRMWAALARLARPILAQISRPALPPLLVLLGAVAVAAAMARARARGWDGVALGVGGTGAMVIAAALGTVLTGQYRLPLPAAVRSALSAIGGLVPAALRPVLRLAALVVAVGGAGWLAWTNLGGVRLASVASLPLIGSKTVEGRASVVAGDVIRVGGVLVRLNGVEAPDREQRCAAPGNKRWRCGEAASDALTKVIRGRQVRCDVRGADETGRSYGTCTAGSDDIAAKVVREGAVFAAGGLFAAYGSAEKEARAQKVGLWRVSDVERPAEWRAKLWDTAKKAAPDGCPIKGQVSSSRKTYLLPWSPDYDGAKVRTSRGERWFCSEQEAVAAGWRPQ